MRTRIAAAGFALLAGSVLLSSCGAGPGAGACDVKVDTPDLVQGRQAAGIADCTPKNLATTPDGAADLPDTTLGCLGSSTRASLADIKGPTVINFWSSNCGPCRKEMPALAGFLKQYGDQVGLVGVDYLDTYPGAALDLAKQTGVHYPLLVDACGDLQQTSLGVPIGLPFFYFVHGDGSVSGPVTGGKESVAETKAMVEENLGITIAGHEGGGS
jgi:thiol-disulfide isomerase/thioredoxin